MTTVMVCLGLALLIARPTAGRWIWCIPALGGSLMGASLLLQATHWFTDVVGGGLLSNSLLAFATASGLSRWSHGPAETDDGSGISEVGRAPQVTLAGSLGTDTETR
jgi:hypothetical protein